MVPSLIGQDHLALTRRKVPFPKHYYRSSPTVPRASATCSVSYAKTASGRTSAAPTLYLNTARTTTVRSGCSPPNSSTEASAARWISCGPSACRRAASFGASTPIAPAAWTHSTHRVRPARLGADAGGHGPSTTVAGSGLEPERSRRAPGPEARHTPQGHPPGASDQTVATSTDGVSTGKRLRGTTSHWHRQIHASRPRRRGRDGHSVHTAG